MPSGVAGRSTVLATPAATRRWPQLRQNERPAWFSVPQRGHGCFRPGPPMPPRQRQAARAREQARARWIGRARQRPGRPLRRPPRRGTRPAGVVRRTQPRWPPRPRRPSCRARARPRRTVRRRVAARPRGRRPRPGRPRPRSGAEPRPPAVPGSARRPSPGESSARRRVRRCRRRAALSARPRPRPHRQPALRLPRPVRRSPSGPRRCWASSRSPRASRPATRHPAAAPPARARRPRPAARERLPARAHLRAPARRADPAGRCPFLVAPPAAGQGGPESIIADAPLPPVERATSVPASGRGASRHCRRAPSPPRAPDAA